MIAKRLRAFCLIAALAVLSCAPRGDVTEIRVQRFFGECNAQYGALTDPGQAESECGIMTALTNAFVAQNPDVRVRVNVVQWPGYDQLSAQLAAGDAPDIVAMHQSSLADYQIRGLLEPMRARLIVAGVDPLSFTDAARNGAARGGDIYGLPIDTWAQLWHVNLNLFRQAGLVRDGAPVLPTSPEELLAQARQFTRATGKPYFVQSMANERAAYTRNLYTLLMQQGSDFFADPKRIRLQTPEARRIVELFKQIYDEGLTTRNQDYSAATAGFINGEGGIYLVGTWLIGDFQREAERESAALYGGYAVAPYPQLYHARDVAFVDGHAWAVPARERTPAEEEAVFRFLRFFAEHNFDWSRTGHLPAMQNVLESERFLDLPHRRAIASLAATGQTLPPEVQRQNPIQDIIGDEMAAAITGAKSIDDALADAEHRVNDLLFHLI